MKAEGTLSEITYPPLDLNVTEPRLVVIRSIEQEPGLTAYLLGLDHFNDPSDPKWPLLLAVYGHFNAQSHKSTRSLSITEGDSYTTQASKTFKLSRSYRRDAVSGVQIFGIQSAEKALREGGEQAAHRYLAIFDGHEAENSEPPVKREVMEMVELFGVPYTSYFYYMRYARQYLASIEAGGNLPDYHTYVGSRQSHQVRKVLALLDFSLDSLRRTHEKLYPDTPFDPSQPLSNGHSRTSEYYKLMYFPFDQGKTWDDLTLIQEMALYCNLLRDRYHASMVFKVWPEGGREVTYMLDTHGPPHNVVLEATARKIPGLDVKSYAGWTACREVLGLE
jgi:hypothetical protein